MELIPVTCMVDGDLANLITRMAEDSGAPCSHVYLSTLLTRALLTDAHARSLIPRTDEMLDGLSP